MLLFAPRAGGMLTWHARLQLCPRTDEGFRLGDSLSLLPSAAVAWMNGSASRSQGMGW